MATAKTKFDFKMIAGILFAVYAFLELLVLARFAINAIRFDYSIGFFTLVLRILWVAGPALCAVFCFMKEKTPLAMIGGIILAVLGLYLFISGFSNGTYEVVHYHYSYIFDSHYSYDFNFFCMLPTLLEMFASIAFAYLAVCSFATVSESVKKLNKSVWFIPGILMLLSVFLNFVLSIALKGKWNDGAFYFHISSFADVWYFLRPFILYAAIIGGYTLFGLWSTGATFSFKKPAPAVQPTYAPQQAEYVPQQPVADFQNNLQFFQDLYVRGEISAEEYEAHRKRITGM